MVSYFLFVFSLAIGSGLLQQKGIEHRIFGGVSLTLLSTLQRVFICLGVLLEGTLIAILPLGLAYGLLVSTQILILLLVSQNGSNNGGIGTLSSGGTGGKGSSIRNSSDTLSQKFTNDNELVEMTSLEKSSSATSDIESCAESVTLSVTDSAEIVKHNSDGSIIIDKGVSTIEGGSFWVMHADLHKKSLETELSTKNVSDGSHTKSGFAKPTLLRSTKYHQLCVTASFGCVLFAVFSFCTREGVGYVFEQESSLFRSIWSCILVAGALGVAKYLSERSSMTREIVLVVTCILYFAAIVISMKGVTSNLDLPHKVADRMFEFPVSQQQQYHNTVSTVIQNPAVLNSVLQNPNVMQSDAKNDGKQSHTNDEKQSHAARQEGGEGKLAEGHSGESSIVRDTKTANGAPTNPAPSNGASSNSRPNEAPVNGAPVSGNNAGANGSASKTGSRRLLEAVGSSGLNDVKDVHAKAVNARGHDESHLNDPSNEGRIRNSYVPNSSYDMIFLGVFLTLSFIAREMSKEPLQDALDLITAPPLVLLYGVGCIITALLVGIFAYGDLMIISLFTEITPLVTAVSLLSVVGIANYPLVSNPAGSDNAFYAGASRPPMPEKLGSGGNTAGNTGISTIPNNSTKNDICILGLMTPATPVGETPGTTNDANVITPGLLMSDNERREINDEFDLLEDKVGNPLG